MNRLRGFATAHPRTGDAGLAVLVGLIGVPASINQGVDTPGAWLWIAAVHLPLVWRRRAPVVVCWTVIALVGIGDWLGPDAAYQFFVPLVGLYAVARYRSRRQVLPVTGALAAVLVVAFLLQGMPWSAMVALAGVWSATVLLGVTLQTRRAYLAGLEERARRLEHERDQRARLAVVAERTRIARELHDIVAHHLAVMVALGDGAALTATTDPHRAARTMGMVSATGREALGEMRRLIGLLRDGGPERPDQPGGSAAVPAPQPGLADLPRLVEQVRAAGLRVSLTQRGVPGAWGPGAGLAIYRIVQEALTNTLKHAGPGAGAAVRLRYAPATAEVAVTDDGGRRPVPAPAGRVEAPAGHGLAGMAERVGPYRGRVVAGPAGGGWRVRAWLRFDEPGRGGGAGAADDPAEGERA